MKWLQEKNTAICFDRESFTYSNPKQNWRAWFIQKKRHLSTAKFYKPKHKLALGIFYLSNVAFWILAIVAFLFLDWKVATGIIVFRFGLELIVMGQAFLKLNEKNLIPFIPILEIFLLLTQMSTFISNSISKPKRWK